MISHVPVRPGSRKVVQIENEFVCKTFKAIHWKGPTSNGGVREDDLLQFYAVEGGLRTVARKDIVRIR